MDETYRQQKKALQIGFDAQVTEKDPIPIILNPPWVVILKMLFIILGYPISRLVWLMFSIGSIILSTQLLWRSFNSTHRQLWIDWTIIVLYKSSIWMLRVGQFLTPALLAITLLLYFTILQINTWATGIALALVTIKPQVIIIFLLALLFWIIEQRLWKILVSSSAYVLLLTLIALIFNQQIIYQYIAMLNASFIPDLATPTIGSYLRFIWLGTEKYWLQILPIILGLIGFIYYLNKKHKTWSWTTPAILVRYLLANRCTSVMKAAATK
jgi:hypothetical protein